MEVLSGPMSVNATSVFKEFDEAKILSIVHNKYVVVPADKAQNIIKFVCKTHEIKCIY